MPRGNGTGPAGMGTMTGRGAGFCAGYRTPGFMTMGSWKGTRLRQNRRYSRFLWLGGIIPGCAYLAYRWANRNIRKY